MPSPPIRPPVSLEVANKALSAAIEMRADYLLSITSGDITPLDLIRKAARPTGRPLLKMSLTQILIAQQGWGAKKAQAALMEICAVLKTDLKSEQKNGHRLTVGWLLDPRAGGRRLMAWVDVVEIRTRKMAPPWSGFPFAQNTGEGS